MLGLNVIWGYVIRMGMALEKISRKQQNGIERLPLKDRQMHNINLSVVIKMAWV